LVRLFTSIDIITAQISEFEITLAVCKTDSLAAKYMNNCSFLISVSTAALRLV